MPLGEAVAHRATCAATGDQTAFNADLALLRQAVGETDLAQLRQAVKSKAMAEGSGASGGVDARALASDAGEPTPVDNTARASCPLSNCASETPSASLIASDDRFRAGLGNTSVVIREVVDFGRRALQLLATLTLPAPCAECGSAIYALTILVRLSAPRLSSTSQDCAESPPLERKCSLCAAFGDHC